MLHQLHFVQLSHRFQLLLVQPIHFHQCLQFAQMLVLRFHYLKLLVTQESLTSGNLQLMEEQHGIILVPVAQLIQLHKQLQQFTVVKLFVRVVLQTQQILQLLLCHQLQTVIATLVQPQQLMKRF